MQQGMPLGDWYRDFCDGPAAQYMDAFFEWENPSTRTRLASERMTEAEAEFLPALRELYHVMVSHPDVLNDDLAACGFPKRRAGKYKPSPVAKDPPGFAITPLTSHRLRIDFFYITGTGKPRKGKLRGQYGAEIRWDYVASPGSDPDPDPDSLLCSEIATASPFVLAFPPDNRGQLVRIALRWENRRGQKGPWSPPAECPIP
jgi:hypothetical protein